MQPQDGGELLYIRLRGQVSGPFNRAQLRKLFEQGQLTAFHEVSDDGRRWALAGELGLTASLAGPAAPIISLAPQGPLGPPPPGLSPPPVAVPSPLGPPVPAGPRYFFMGPDSPQRYGPYTREQVQRLVQQGTVSPDYLVWCEGWPSWLPLPQTDLAPAVNRAPLLDAGPAPAPRLRAPAYIDPAPARSSRPRPGRAGPLGEPAPAAAARGGGGGGLRLMGLAGGVFLVLAGLACGIWGWGQYADLTARDKEARDSYEARRVLIVERKGHSFDEKPPVPESRMVVWVIGGAAGIFLVVGLGLLGFTFLGKKQAAPVRRR